jgi:hypothetical protein
MTKENNGNLDFRKEHKMTLVNYFSQFKAKLKMPRLERPAAERGRPAQVSSPQNFLCSLVESFGVIS